MHDLFSKRTPIRNLITKDRKSDEEVYELETRPGLANLHFDFTSQTFRRSRARLMLVFGRKHREHIEKSFRIKPVSGLDKYRIVEMEIDGIEVS